MHKALLSAFVGIASVALPLAVGCGGGSGAAAGGDTTAASGGNHPLVGKQEPDFTLTSVNTKEKVDTTKLRGKVVIVDFWATWCEPCKKSFPKLQDLYTKYKASGLEMVGISEDDENTGIKDFGDTYGAKFPIGWDDGKTIAGKWSIPNMPSTFIVDKHGVVQFVHLGYHDGEEAEIEKEVKGLL